MLIHIFLHVNGLTIGCVQMPDSSYEDITNLIEHGSTNRLCNMVLGHEPCDL